VKVCSVDTGVATDNPAISPAIIAGTNTDDVTQSTAWADDNGHGTFVAGEIVARGPELVGVAPKASLLVAKVLDKTASGNDLGVSSGILWCVSQRAQVLNISLGGQGGNAALGLRQTITWACTQGVDIAIASGNAGTAGWASPNVPANVAAPCVIAVNALNRHGVMTNFSNYAENRQSLDAPGQGIAGYLGNSIAIGSGTSFSAPLVAGGLALLRGMGASSSEAVSYLLSNADNTARQVHLSKGKYRNIYGYGALDVDAACRAYAEAHAKSAPRTETN